MQLLELAVQGVRGFSPSVRAPFRPGYNVLVPPQGVAPGLGPLVTALYYGDGRGTDGALAAGEATARAGLSLFGKDGRTYRLMRALGGAGVLHRLELDNSWTVVSQDAAEISQALRAALGLPSRGQFEELFCFDAAGVPSRRPAVAQPSPASLASGPAALARPSAVPEPRSLRPNALVEAALAAAAGSRPRQTDRLRAQRDLDRLREEIEAGKQIDEQQYKLEGLQQALFDLELQLKHLDALKQEAKDAQVELEGLHTLETLNLPKDAVERAARFDEAKKKRDEALDRLREEQQAAEEASSVKPSPLWQQPQFPLGVGAGLLTFSLGVAFRGSPWGYLGLLDIPAFGYAGLVALRWIGAVQAREGLSRRQNIFRDRDQKLEAAFENEYLPIKAAMKLLGVEKGAELVEHFKRREAVEAARRDAEARLEAAEHDPATAAMRTRQVELKAEVAELEAMLGRLGASATRDWRDAEREVAELEESLASPSTPAPEPDHVEPVALGGSLASQTAAAAWEDPAPRLFSIAEDLFTGMALDALTATVSERAGQYFSALTEKRFTGLELDSRGQAKAVAPGRTVPAGALDEPDIDLLYLAVKLTLVEKLAATTKVTVILDEPFASFDEAKQQLLSRMLKYIAAQTQVIHATALATHRGHADASVSG